MFFGLFLYHNYMSILEHKTLKLLSSRHITKSQSQIHVIQVTVREFQTKKVN